MLILSELLKKNFEQSQVITIKAFPQVMSLGTASVKHQNHVTMVEQTEHKQKGFQAVWNVTFVEVTVYA